MLKLKQDPYKVVLVTVFFKSWLCYLLLFLLFFSLSSFTSVDNSRKRTLLKRVMSKSSHNESLDRSGREDASPPVITNILVAFLYHLILLVI